MADEDRLYFERRRRESLARAEAAADPGIARIHREFASQYARALRQKPPVTFAPSPSHQGG